MRRLLTALLPVLLLLGSVSASRAADQPLTLVQAIERAAVGNADLRRERITIELAEAQLEASRGQFDFRLLTDLTFSRRTTPPLSAGDLQSGFVNNLVLDVGIARALETGGSVRFNLRNNASNTNNRFDCGTDPGAPQTDCTVYGSNMNLNFTHPLLRGFGSEVVQANFRRQRVQKDQALLNRQTRAANVIRDVINAYWELAYSTQDLAIRRSAVELAREQLRITQAQIEVGRLAPVDAAAVERAIGERSQEVVVSEQSLFFRTLELRRLFGMTADGRTPLFAASDAPTATPRDVNVDLEMTRALESNPQLKSIRLGQRLSDIDIQTARSSLRPQLDFLGNVGSTGRRGDLASTLGRTVGLDDMVWSAGLNLNMPLENRLAEGQMRAANLNAERARLESGDLELEIRDQVLRLSSMVRTASRRVELARSTVGYAQQNLEAEKARFSVGRSTNNEVLRLQQELKSAEIGVVRATVDLLVSETALQALTGELLETYKIALKGM